MSFSLFNISPPLVRALREFINQVGPQYNLKWSTNPAERTIDIRESYDSESDASSSLPRILVTRQDFTADKAGLDTDAAETAPFKVSMGDKDITRFVMYRGSVSIAVEASSKGMCEMIADMVVHFIIWVRPELCATLGWKEFGLPITASGCSLSSEDPNIAKFTIQVSTPVVIEERWNLTTVSPTLKKVLFTVQDNSAS